MMGQGIFISYPYDLGKAGGSKVEVMVALGDAWILWISHLRHAPLTIPFEIDNWYVLNTDGSDWIAVNDKLCFMQMSFSNIS